MQKKKNSSKNEAFDEWILHRAELELYGNSLYAEFLADIEDYEAAVDELVLQSITTNTKEKEMEKTNENLISTLVAAGTAVLFSAVTELSKKESEWISSYAKDNLGFTPKIPKELSSKVKNMPYSTMNNISTFMLNYSVKLKNSVDSLFKSARTFGMDISESFKNLMKTTKNQVKNEVVTIGPGIANSVDKLILFNNESKFGGYVWEAILDSSACIACGEMNGTVYKTLSDCPFYPMHNNCRCSLVPFKGEAPEVESYSTWLASQSSATQRKILGKTRYELYKGGMDVRNFVNDGRKLTLDEIYSR